MISDSVNSFHVGFVKDEENINTKNPYDLYMCMPVLTSMPVRV